MNRRMNFFWRLASEVPYSIGGTKGVSSFSTWAGTALSLRLCFSYMTILEPVNSGYFISREPAHNSAGILMPPYSHNHEYLWIISATRRGSGRIFAGESGRPNCIVKSKGTRPHNRPGHIACRDRHPVLFCPQSDLVFHSYELPNMSFSV